MTIAKSALPELEPIAVRNASPSGRISLFRRLASYPAMLSALLTALAFLTVRSRFADPDLWWHLRTGQIIWQTHHIPSTDVFSWTTHHHAFIAHEWLTQLSLFAAFHWGGYTGVALWQCLLTAAILIAAYALSAAYSGNAKVAFLGGLTVWYFATIGFGPRPHLIGYLLLIVELGVLHLGRSRSPNWFFALPPLFALWVNLHGSWFAGLAVAGAILLASFFPFQSGLLISDPWPPERRRKLIIALALVPIALCLNPAGIEPIIYPLNAASRQTVGLTQVLEWQPLDMGDSRGLAMLAVCIAIVLIPLLRRTPLYLHEIFLLALGTYSACSHRRLLFLFGILVAPTVCRLLSDAWENYSPEKDMPVPNAVLIVAALITSYLAFPSKTSLAQQVAASSPIKAVEFLRATHPPGPILNEYEFGGYLIWAAPEYPVFIDGRGDVYDWTGVFARFSRWATLQEDPNQLLNQYGVNLILLAHDSPMAHVVALLPGWQSIYSDSNAVIFRRTVPLPPATLP